MELSFLLVFLYLIPGTHQGCVWYGECNKLNNRMQNCLATGPPQALKNPQVLNKLEERCPFLLKDFPEKKFCCDDDQVETMIKSIISAASVFGRCPTCMANLNRHICSMTCSPNQTDFIKPVDIQENKDGEKYILKIDIHLSKEYKEKTYDSCKEVMMPSTAGKAMENACGKWGASNQCNAERWFEFFGDFDENLRAPFYINYNPPPEGEYKQLHIDTLPCNASYESSKPCSCSDCEASCTIPFEHSLPPADDDTFFILTIVFGALVSCGVLVLLIRHHYFQKNDVNSVDNVEMKSQPNCLTRGGDKIKKFLVLIFTKWGTGCARNPVLVFAISSWVIAGLGYGISYLKVTTDPMEIWASPICQTRQDKTYFDSRFTPFYRTNQIFIKSKGLEPFNWTLNNVEYRFGPAFNAKFLQEVYNLQMKIQKLGAEDGNGLKKICFAPMINEFFSTDGEDYCTVQSVWGYFQNDITVLNDTDKLYGQLVKCVRNNYDPNCLGPYKGPILSPLALGGFPEDIENEGDVFQDKHLLSTGVTLTFLVNNAVRKTDLEPALAWEKMFIDFMKEWIKKEKPDIMEVAFSAERSIQDEIERESEAEMTTIIVSYLVMFIYITISLGRIRGFSSSLLDSKFTLGIGGILIVLASVIASLGVFGYLGVATTLLTIEVIPFLVLAVGVDNIFILVHTYQNQQQKPKGDNTVEIDIGLALGKVGPAILLTSTSEAACFFIGTLSGMPAIKTFAQYSSLAIIFNFLLQISCFVSLLALDSRRQISNRADIFCCIKIKKGERQENSSNILQMIFKNYYGPFLMKPFVRITVIMVFVAWTFYSIVCIPGIEKGLDQELSMPEDSYVIDYFRFMKDLLSVGPPVYFVIKNGLNFTNPNEVNAICGSVGCDSDSLVTYLTRASRLGNISYIAKSPSSWIDDYFDWLSIPQECCKEFKVNSSFCPHDKPHDICDTCDIKMMDWRPNDNDFKKYLPYFLNDNPDLFCPKAGHASYAGGVIYEIDDQGKLEVQDNYFMAYHTSLKTSRDFYMALENARKISNHLSGVLTKKLNRTIEVFPYSIFYVYYEQYLTIVKDALTSLSLSLFSVFIMTFIFTGFHLKSAILVFLVVASILVNMTGMLYWWNITLNAISLVNLIVAVGIGVEFCSHIMHTFVSSTETDKTSRALYAVSTMGSSVFSGITLTKFLGIVVLAFAQTLMLRTFYFKMYLGIVIMGAAHGLVLMPVLLSYFG